MYDDSGVRADSAASTAGPARAPGPLPVHVGYFTDGAHLPLLSVVRALGILALLVGGAQLLQAGVGGYLFWESSRSSRFEPGWYRGFYIGLIAVKAGLAIALIIAGIGHL